MNDLNDLNDFRNLPKGMSFPKSEETKEIINNIKIKDVNYVKLLHDKIKEIENVNYEIKRIEVKEDEKESSVLLLINVKKK